MNKQRILDILHASRAELEGLGVASLALFGSAARDEAGAESDVDLLVEFFRPVSLFHIFRLKRRLESILTVRSVDLVERDVIHPALKDRILAEAVGVA
jgi:predicted nucleotidyltransferase